MKNFKKNLIIFFMFLSLIFIVSLISIGKISFDNFSKGRLETKIGKSLNQKDANKKAENAIKYINENFLPLESQAKLVRITEESELYKITLKIKEQEFNSYMTKDGKYFFPQEPINLFKNKEKLVNLEIPKKEKPEIKLFVMSYCPYGNIAEEMLKPVANLLKEKADIELGYVIYSNYRSGYPKFCLDKENRYCSMHGIDELKQDIREMCVQKYQKEKFWNFIEVINRDTSVQDIESKWEKIAKDIGIDIKKIKTCEKEEWKDLLKRELELNNKEYPVQNPNFHQGREKIKISGSPTLVINSIIYDGPRSVEGYKNAICSAFKKAPKECEIKLEKKSSLVPVSGDCQ